MSLCAAAKAGRPPPPPPPPPRLQQGPVMAETRDWLVLQQRPAGRRLLLLPGFSRSPGAVMRRHGRRDAARPGAVMRRLCGASWSRDAARPGAVMRRLCGASWSRDATARPP